MGTRNIILSADCRRLGSALEAARYEVAQEDSADTFLATAERTRPAFALVGWPEPGNRIRLVARLGEVMPQGAVVVLYDQPDEAELLAIVHAGGAGYLPANILPERLLATLQAVEAGEMAIPRSLTASLVRQIRSPGCTSIRIGDDLCIELSDREWDVLCQLAEGYTTNEIADRLFVCPATIRSHVSAIMRILCVADRDAALDAVFADSH
jgi:DNA-binding NarL/FixJ family response regulator